MKTHRKLSVEQLEIRALMTGNASSLASLLALPSYSSTGGGNNLAHPNWGAAGSDLLRSILPSAYGDGIANPNGQNLPSARTISNLLGSQVDSLLDPRDITAFTYAWGQFIDHDLDLTPDGGASLPIAVPKGDAQFDPNSTGTQTLPFTRSLTDPTTGTSRSNPLNQVTVVTSFLDGSQIYGSDPARAAALRTFQGGRLKTSAGNMLPFNTTGLPNSNEGPTPDAQLYLGGDVRANENIELTSLQTLFMREHNYWAAKISAANPQLTDEQIYQQARSIVIAEIQSITYSQFLPAVLGTGALTSYKSYQPTVNPGITAEFSEAAFRFGHSQLDDDVEFMTNNGSAFSFTYNTPYGTQVTVNTPADVANGETGMSLGDAFFAPYILQQPGVMDGILKYLASDVAQAVDLQMVDSVRNILFGAPGSGAGGQDLFALDIQRGREVGLPTYNAARVAYGLPAVTSFAQITSDPAVQQQLKAVYGTVDKVELFVGGLAEDHARGSSVGPTFQAIIANQFERLRDGDRMWYQNIFKGSQLATIQNTTLADIIERNTQLTNLQDNVFTFRAGIGGTVFKDSNGNGRIDRSEPGIGGLTVQLIEATTGEVLATTKTNRLGQYAFNVTEAARYTVQVATGGTTASRDLMITRGDQFASQFNLALTPSRGPTRPHDVNIGGSGGGSQTGGGSTTPHATPGNLENAPQGNQVQSPTLQASLATVARVMQALTSRLAAGR